MGELPPQKLGTNNKLDEFQVARRE